VKLKVLEPWLRIFKAGLSLPLTAAGFIAIFAVSEGWVRVFLLLMFFPYMLTVAALDLIEIGNIASERKNKRTEGQ
jgi:hypothetical protein